MKVVGCFLEYDGRFLILLRHSNKPAGDTWGLPAGKVEPGETGQGAIIREVREETGYPAEERELENLGTYDFDNERTYSFVTYRIKPSKLPDIILEDGAHTDYMWVTAQECLAMKNLIPDFPELLQLTGYVNV